jgi:hypothetical protein
MRRLRQVIAGHPILSLVVAIVVGAALVGAVWGIVAASIGGTPSASDSRTPKPTVIPTATPHPTTTAVATPGKADCSAGGTTVSDAASLQRALDAAQPGTTITLRPGSYVGNFTASASGTASSPITLCGPSSAVLDGGSTKKGYVFHLDHASYWKLAGFTVTNGQKGVVTDGTVGSLIQGLTVTAIGDEAIHLRDFSTDNTVDGNTVSRTGLLKTKFGEGIYIGSAKSNWCTYSDCKADASDRNVISNNTITQTTAESVDIKEGTSHGVLKGNTFDGSSLVESGADSWVDVKGDDWVISGNTGTNSPNDGFQTHQIVDGMGTRNVFSHNVANVNGPGYGFAFKPALDNVVDCDNTVTGAGSGLSNVTCTGG